MGRTHLSLKEDKFLINNVLTYTEITTSPEHVRGMLMNARFIQGVFDDASGTERYHRFGEKTFSAVENTKALIEALPDWYAHGLRAITVGMQGGGPCFTCDNYEIENNPYCSDGKRIDADYFVRMAMIIEAADQLGMVVIVSLFYGAQTRFLEGNEAVAEAVRGVSAWLKDKGYSNVVIEIANEYDISCFKRHTALSTPEGIVGLMAIAREASGGMPVGCSGTGGHFSEAIAQASDVILIHANGQTRQQFYNLIQKAKAIYPKRPIVCNEDSQAISQLTVAFKEGVSWGYYNNMTKQEPPVKWMILEGEDTYFAKRMAKGLGIPGEELQKEAQFYLQGLEKDIEDSGRRWIRLASLEPEKIDYVEFYRNGTYYATAYDDPFTIHYQCTWRQMPVLDVQKGEVWEAKIYLLDGQILQKQAVAL